LVTPAAHVAAMTPTTYGSMVAGGESSEMAHASGNIVSLTAPVVAGSAGYTRVDQTMADTRFGDSLFRNVLLSKFTTFTANHEESLQPWVLWAADPFVAEKLKNFNYIRGSMVISGVLKAPPLAAGLVVVTFVPSYEATSWTPVNPIISTVLPHVVVDLSTSSDFEVTLPWIVSSDWGNLADDLYSLYWTVQIRVLSPMISGIPDGCASAQLTIFARPGEDFQLSGATYQSGRVGHTRPGGRSAPPPSVSSLPAFSTSKPSAPGKPQETLQSSVNSYSVAKTGYKPSEVLSKISNFAAPFSVIPVIGEAAGIVSGAAALASSWASWFGFTRDTVVGIPSPVVNRAYQNVVHCDGNDASQSASLMAHNSISIDPAINGTMSAIDETALGFINSRYTLIGKFQYTVGDTAPQDQLIPVTPCIGVFGPGDTTYIPSTAGYQAGKFAQWRGDMKYIFYPVVSAVHRGALQFIWQPIPRSASVPIDLTNISLNTIVDIGAAQPIEIKVGYNNDNPMCFTDFYALDTPLDLADYSTLNGYLRVRAINPIVGSICGQVVDVLVFAAAGENMEFAVPTEIAVIEGDFITWGEGLDIAVELQSATVGAGGQNMVCVDLVPSSGAYPVADILAGEQIRSLRALVQKPSVSWDLDPSVDGPSKFHYHTPYRLDDPCNYFNYFGSQFLSFAGGVRYKVIIDGDYSTTGTITEFEKVPSIQSAVSGQASFPVGQFNPTCSEVAFVNETTVPYYWNEKWVPAYKNPIPVDTIVWDYLDPVSLRIATYKSAGPDARLTFFRAQNTWFFVSRTTPSVAVFQITGLNGATPPAIAARSRSSDKTDVNQITLQQYRARTGRSEFKTTRRTSTRRILRSIAGPLIPGLEPLV
jgi:hypothetical protein